MAQAASTTCDICVAAPGTDYCVHCEQQFCDSCKGLHKRTKATKNHRFQSESNVVYESLPRCKEHNEEFIYLCSSCDYLVCRRCISGKHNGHKVCDINISISSLKESLKKKINSKLILMNGSVKQIQNGIDSFNAEVESVLRSIIEDGNKMKAMIDRQVDQLVNSVKSNAKMETDKLSKMLEEESGKPEHGKTLEKRINELDKIRDDALLFEKLKNLTIEMDKIQMTAVPEFPFVRYTRTTKTEKDIEMLMGSVNQCEMKIKENKTTEQQPMAKKEEEHKRLYKCSKCGYEKVFPNEFAIGKCYKCGIQFSWQFVKEV